jgi:hypothetical protein
MGIEMSINLDTHKAPRPAPKEKPTLPILVQEYLESVRGHPEISCGLRSNYLDQLWDQANEFAERNGVECPVHRAELDALRQKIEVDRDCANRCV